MTDDEEYVDKLLVELEEVKASGGKGLYHINDKITDNTATYVKRYFNNHPVYFANCRKCPTCIGTWDVIIMIRNTP